MIGHLWPMELGRNGEEENENHIEYQNFQEEWQTIER